MKETFIIFIAFVIGMAFMINKGGDEVDYDGGNDGCFGDDSEPGDSEQFEVEVLG